MHKSPRIRRLHNDLAALDRLRSESSVFRFSAQGDPPQQYMISFRGKGLWRDRGKVRVLEDHRVEIKLGASYPRTIPEIRWMTPVYHPNISEIGMVCLGGYGTHWVPSVQLDELCVMLWDMARYHNYDIRSPYNREAALWVANQTTFLFPTDSRPVRDLRAALGRVAATGDATAVGPGSTAQSAAKGIKKFAYARPPEVDLPTQVARVRQFISRYGRIFITPDVTELEQPEAIGNRPPSNHEANHEANVPATVVADSGQANRLDLDLDELVILEPVATVQPPIGVPHSAGEDILFIE
jgi:ubiquitin-protein ligase